MEEWSRRAFSFEYRARVLAVMAIAIPILGLMAAVIVPRMSRALW